MRLFSATFARSALILLALSAALPFAAADQPTLTIRAQGTLTFDDDGLAVAQLHGTAPGMGKFVCYAEIVFVPDTDGSLTGEGLVAFTAADGDVVTGVIAWQIDAAGANTILVHWRDAVTFSDGTIIATTGRFVDHRPPGPIYMYVEA